MVLTDWTEQLGGSNIGATGDQAQSGSKSLQMDGGNTEHVITRDDSEQSSPTQGQVETYIRWNSHSTSMLPAAIFRFNPPSDYYLLRYEVNFDDVELATLESGQFNSVDSDSSVGGQQTDDTWTQFRFTMWENSGNLNFRIEQNTGSGFSQLGRDLTDTSPSFTGGGAIGVGGNNFDSGKVWFDETELFW